MTNIAKTIATLAVGVSLPLCAQWQSNRDSKPDLTAPLPRVNGKPDLSGVWQADRTPTSEFTRVLGDDIAKMQIDLNDVTKHFLNVFGASTPKTNRCSRKEH